jgi:uncharacterized protein
MFRIIFNEIMELFKKERFYRLLFVAIALFYFFLILISLSTKNEGTVASLPAPQERVLDDPGPLHQEYGMRVDPDYLKSPAIQFATYSFIGIFMLSFYFGTQDVWRWFQRQDVIPLATDQLRVSWGIAEFVKVTILFFGFGIFINLLLQFLKFSIFKSFGNSSLVLTQAFFLDLAAVFFMAQVIRSKGSRLSDLVGFQFPNVRLSEVWLGIRTYIVILPVFMLILLILVLVANWAKYSPPPHPLVDVFMKERQLSYGMIGFSFFLACFVGPVVEEIFFRGFLYPIIKKYWGMQWAMTITAALFAGVHENIFSFFPIFFLGLVLAYLYEKRQGIVSCVSLHVMHNTAFIVYFFIIKSVLIPQAGL